MSVSVDIMFLRQSQQMQRNGKACLVIWVVLIEPDKLDIKRN